jgi:iron complex outermembrane receptor protein
MNKPLCKHVFAEPASNRKVAITAMLIAGVSQLVFVQGAAAQVTLPPQSGAQTPPTPLADGGGLEEIVVTAQRRQEKLQDVPIAITALSANALAKQGTISTFDLGAAVPGLIVSRNGTAVQPYLRGVGTSATAAGNDPSIAIYVDGVYQSAPTASLFNFNNIERIEVLKGPQGTLFGRNATAGLIQIITKDPTEKTVAKASLGYGNFQAVTGNAYIAAGSEQVAADLAVSFTNQNKGWGRNLFTPAQAGTVLFNNAPITVSTPKSQAGTDNELGLHSKVILRPDDRATIKLSVGYQYTNSDQSIYRHALPGAILSAAGTVPYVFDGGFWDYNSDAKWQAKSRVIQSAVDVNYSADFATFRSISSYLNAYSHLLLPSDSTPQVSGANTDALFKFRTFTQEFQILSDPETAPERLSWIMGGYFLHSTAGGLPSRAVRGSVDLGLARNSEQTTDSLAAFGQVTWKLTSTTRLTGGLRYTHDNQAAYQYNVGEQVSTLPAPTLVNTVGNITSVVPTQTVQFHNISWRASIDQKLAPDILLYVSASTGYKAGSWNVVSMCLDSPAAIGACKNIAPPVAPEKLAAYEVGVKSEFLDHRLRLNVSAFYYKYTNQQVSVTQPSAPGQPTQSFTTNAAGSRIYGVDFDALARVTRNFQIKFAAEFLNAKYTSFPNANVFVPRTVAPYNDAGVVIDASGKYLNKAPKFTSTLSADWTIPLPTGELALSGAWYHNSGFFWEPSNRLREAPQEIFNSQLAYHSPGDKWGARLWGKNLTNKKYYSYQTSTSAGDQGAPAAPRTYGISLEWQL